MPSLTTRDDRQIGRIALAHFLECSVRTIDRYDAEGTHGFPKSRQTDLGRRWWISEIEEWQAHSTRTPKQVGKKRSPQLDESSSGETPLSSTKLVNDPTQVVQ